MTTSFSDFHDELRDVARDGLAAAGPDAPVGPSLLADAGWSGLEVAESLGGSGATFAEVAVVLQELGRAAARSAYFGSAVLAVGALGLVESGPGHDDLLRALASGEVAATLALGAGVVPGAWPFRVERDAGGLRVHGRAPFVVDAPAADRLLLPAQRPGGGAVLVAVDRGQPSLTVAAQPVLDATRELGEVVADGVPVGGGAAGEGQAELWPCTGDPDAVLGMLGDRAAVAVACDSLGVAEAMLEATVEYAKAREQFGRPIGSFQAVKHACADMMVHVAVARELVTAAVEQLVSGDPKAGKIGAGNVEAGVAASMAKSYACAAAVDVVGAAMQLHGGIGYTWESGIHTYLKRATLNRSLFGSPGAHRGRLAARYR